MFVDVSKNSLRARRPALKFHIFAFQVCVFGYSFVSVFSKEMFVKFFLNEMRVSMLPMFRKS